MMMELSGFILCCAVKRTVTTKQSYMTSLHPVKVKALRDTGEILFVGACTPILQFSLYI